MINKPEVFDEDYYLNGIKTKKSNYENYRWLKSLTVNTAKNLKKYLKLKNGEKILDFGCARGYMVKALRLIGMKSWGYDTSRWVIENGDEEIKKYITNNLDEIPNLYDHIFIKDVLEHIPEDELNIVLPVLFKKTLKSIFIIVPITRKKNEKYVCPRDEMDSTHVIRWNLSDWVEFLQSIQSEFIVSASCQVPGIKPMCYKYPMSYAFIKMNRIK